MLKKWLLTLTVIGLTGCSTADIQTQALQSKEKQNEIPLYVRSGSSDLVPNAWTNAWTGGYCDSNFACTEVTICAEDGECKTINGIIVDTGSVGLRIKKEALGSINKKLIKEVINENSHGEDHIVPVTTKIVYGAKGVVEGQVKEAEIVIGGEKERIPIQVVENDNTNDDWLYSLMQMPRNNGILGIGIDNNTKKTEGIYYAGKKRIFVPKEERVRNPLEKYGVISVRIPNYKELKTTYGYIKLNDKMPKVMKQEWAQRSPVIVSSLEEGGTYVCGLEFFDPFTPLNGESGKVFFDYKKKFSMGIDKGPTEVYENGKLIYRGPINTSYMPDSQKDLSAFGCLQGQRSTKFQ